MSTDAQLDRALALLISSTKRKKRRASLIEVGEALEIAKSHLGSLKDVGDRIGLSGKMLGQFSKISNLSEGLKELVRQRKIDSVDTVTHLAQLSEGDQLEVGRRSAFEDWKTDDVRAFVELRKRDHSAPAVDLADRVFLSKTTKQFVFEFVPRGGLDLRSISVRLEKWIPSEAIISVETSGSKGTVVVSQSGFEALQREAKARNVPIRQLLPQLLYQI
ncbi:MAG: hypothetical protein NTV46_01365 [Verrucomicrobia bacterium]|nr:hypothetical protein [Verrucomicrobiota bacterium]